MLRKNERFLWSCTFCKSVVQPFELHPTDIDTTDIDTPHAPFIDYARLMKAEALLTIMERCVRRNANGVSVAWAMQMASEMPYWSRDQLIQFDLESEPLRPNPTPTPGRND